MAAAATDVAARNLAIAYNSWNHGSDETGAAQLTLSSWVDKTAFRACGLAMGGEPRQHLEKLKQLKKACACVRASDVGE
ncbi:hypothetical protein PSPO01_03304 [Paraphaeosphaeria sporulosa]